MGVAWPAFRMAPLVFPFWSMVQEPDQPEELLGGDVRVAVAVNVLPLSGLVTTYV